MTTTLAQKSAEAGQPRAAVSQQRRRVVQTVLIGLVFLGVAGSLLMNLLMLQALLAQQRAVSAALDVAIIEVQRLESETISYNVRLNQAVPINATVPLRKTFNTKIQTTLPVNTTVTIPLSLLGQTFPVNVPIQVNVPVDLDVPVQVDEQIELNTQVPVDVELPVRIRIADTPLAGYLQRLEDGLRGFRTSGG